MGQSLGTQTHSNYSQVAPQDPEEHPFPTANCERLLELDDTNGRLPRDKPSPFKSREWILTDSFTVLVALIVGVAPVVLRGTGSTAVEAREECCLFNIISFSWFLPLCSNAELSRDFDEFTTWEWLLCP